MNPILSMLLGTLFVLPAQAKMQEMDDQQLAGVNGQGIAFSLEGILLDASESSIFINDITNAAGENVPISVHEFYFASTGSNKGSDLQPVNLGRLGNPFKLQFGNGEDLRTLRDDGVFVQTTPDNVAILELTFPERLTGALGQPCIAGFAAAGTNCSSRLGERLDAGIRFDFQVAAGRTDILNLDIVELIMDGSYLRLWGDEARDQLVGEARINLFAKRIDLMSCIPGTANCASQQEQADRTISLSNTYANVALGYGKSQPLLFDVTSDGQFVIELPNPVSRNANGSARSAAERNAIATDFYTNAPRTNVVIGNFRSGNRSSVTGGYNYGRNAIEGVSINYLKATSRDL
ncbi:hypothetical protein ACIGCM_20120 [Pseudomonas sp. NPDC078700]|uniref:hypothetical protein n=1 Tax=Pseudomonas sp. NPDC078700 TaxID=3364424 RepID=UPI0037CC46F7